MHETYEKRNQVWPITAILVLCLILPPQPSRAVDSSRDTNFTWAATSAVYVPAPNAPITPFFERTNENNGRSAYEKVVQFNKGFEDYKKAVNSGANPKSIGCVIAGIVGTVVAGVIIWGLWKICQHCLKGTNCTPPGTNDADSLTASASLNGGPLLSITFDTNAVPDFGTNRLIHLDLNATTKAPDGSTYYYQSQYGLETDQSLTGTWAASCTVTQWLSATSPADPPTSIAYYRTALYKNGTLVKVIETPARTKTGQAQLPDLGLARSDITGNADKLFIRGVIYY